MTKPCSFPVVAVLLLATAIPSHAQTLTVLWKFNGPNGAQPNAPLVQGADGNLYGTTEAGGSNTNTCVGGCGTVFKITAGGTLTTLDTGLGSDYNRFPSNGLLLANNGDFYGSTVTGGGIDCSSGDGCGTVFRVKPDGALVTIHRFNGNEGAFAEAPLIQANNGNFYGTSPLGGNTSCELGYGCGTVFKVTPGGALTTLHDFCVDDRCSDGYGPYGALVQGTDGNLYGTTSGGGTCYRCGGTIFKITPDGQLTTLHRFHVYQAPGDGCDSRAGLVQATDGNFYGTTASCGGGTGTVFKMTPDGTLTTLHHFSPAGGGYSQATLIQATDGALYGTTSADGAYNYGTVFKITPEGKLTTLYQFDFASGGNPSGGVVQATDGDFYGTNNAGGEINASCPYGCGTVFRLSMGLGPFVTTQPTHGPVGSPIKIFGTNLAGATSVAFNGTAATFTVISPTEITTTVPIDALTGLVQVTTPSGVLSSNVAFLVRPTVSNFLPTSGPIGTVVQINGASLTGTTSVTFAGVRSSFTVVSNTQITATVPVGAQTGPLCVTTPGGNACPGTFTVN